MKKILSVLLAISLMLSVVSLASAENEKTVNIGVTSTIATLNPMAMDATEIVKYATSLVFQSLVEADRELNFVPVLAESITTEDNLHFTIRLKDDAVWKHLAENGHFFPSEFLELEDVGTMFSEFSQELKDLHTFDEFRNFAKVKKLQGTFRGTTGLVSVTLPPSVDLIGEDAFKYCYNLDKITMTSDSVPELVGDPFEDLPENYAIYVPRNSVKAYRTKWAQYADHINPEGTQAGSDEIKTVTVTEPNTLAQKLGLTVTEHRNQNTHVDHKWLTGVSGDYSSITRLKVIGPISGADLSLLRYLAGFCPWSNTRNYAGRLEYIDLYDAQLKTSNYSVASDVNTTRSTYVDKENVLPAYSFLQAYQLKTLILPKTCKEVRSRALQQ